MKTLRELVPLEGLGVLCYITAIFCYVAAMLRHSEKRDVGTARSFFSSLSDLVKLVSCCAMALEGDRTMRRILIAFFISAALALLCYLLS